MTVLLHDRAAPRCVYSDELRTGLFEGRNVLPRQRARGFEVPSVCVQGTTAHLTRRVTDLILVCSERSARCAIRAGEQTIHHASVEHGNGPARWLDAEIVFPFLKRQSRRDEHCRRKSKAAGNCREQRWNSGRTNEPG